MVRKLIIPRGWQCTLAEAPPGPFVTIERPHLLCFKSEYGNNDGRLDIYNDAGEFWCAGYDVIVQPVEMVEEYE